MQPDLSEPMSRVRPPSEFEAMSEHAVYDMAEAVPVPMNPWTPSQPPFSRVRVQIASLYTRSGDCRSEAFASQRIKRWVHGPFR